MDVDHQGLLAEAEAMAGEIVDLRRDIHRHPELGLDNPRTQQLIIDALTPLGYEITTGTDITSVVATLSGDEPGPTHSR
jgi:metal-dependent amidase/aminoacylase/carboxypeptidase family protein